MQEDVAIATVLHQSRPEIKEICRRYRCNKKYNRLQLQRNDEILNRQNYMIENLTEGIEFINCKYVQKKA